MFALTFWLVLSQNVSACLFPLWENIQLRLLICGHWIFSQFAVQVLLQVSAVITHPPCGFRLQLVTCGPSGIAARLNCCAKKRRMNVMSHFFMVALSYLPSKAVLAIRCIFSGAKP